MAPILVTGGTGSFGKSSRARTREIDVKRFVIFSRDEMKQWDMADNIKIARMSNSSSAMFVIASIQSAVKRRLCRPCSGHKIVPTAEYNPFECVKTNIHGAMNVINACIDQNVKVVACPPTRPATRSISMVPQLASDKLFIAAIPQH